MNDMATTGKIVEVLFEKTKETYEHQMQMLPLVSRNEPDAATLQNANNVVWYPVQQHAPVLTGWDLTGQEQDIIEETYPSILEQPRNDLVQQRADNVRDIRFWERRGEQSGMRQATELNRLIASAIATQGSLYYQSNTTSGYNFIAEAQAIMEERQGMMSQPYFMLNDRDNLTFGHGS